MRANQHAAYADASALRKHIVGDSGYGLAYGSHPAGTATRHSDLDLVLISPQPLATDELARLVDAVCDLHRVHGFDLDTEVDYAVKVHAAYADVDAAVALHCFNHDNHGHLAVTPVLVEPGFLNSRTFARRLLLNALTSPHVFLGGDLASYEHQRERAEYALALLAVTLIGDTTTLTLDEAVTAVTHGPGNASGEDFLGYTRNQYLYRTLRRGLAQLEHSAILRKLDATTHEQDHRACRAAVKELQPARESCA